MPTHWDLPANEQRILYPDPRNQEFRDWMVNRINSLFREVGTDGVLIDMMFQKPTYGGTIANTWCQYDKVRCDEYSQGVLDLMQQLKQEVNGEVFMNPLATKFDKGADTDITAEDQIEILRKIDGINIEHFGLSRVGDSPSERNYYKDILYYIKAAQENPDRYFAFNARENWDNFDSIDEAIENGKFLYANYLLGAGANTGFKYHSLFMMIDLPHPSLISGAIGKTFTDGRFILPEQLIPTGNALESFQENGELRTRTFENVFTAVLSPDATQPVIIELPKDYKKDILGMEYA